MCFSSKACRFAISASIFFLSNSTSDPASSFEDSMALYSLLSLSCDSCKACISFDTFPNSSVCVDFKLSINLLLAIFNFSNSVVWCCACKLRLAVTSSTCFFNAFTSAPSFEASAVFICLFSSWRSRTSLFKSLHSFSWLLFNELT